VGCFVTAVQPVSISTGALVGTIKLLVAVGIAKAVGIEAIVGVAVEGMVGVALTCGRHPPRVKDRSSNNSRICFFIHVSVNSISQFYQ
jgi:hypothetical protein